jgi:hypothetical protein
MGASQAQWQVRCNAAVAPEHFSVAHRQTFSFVVPGALPPLRRTELDSVALSLTDQQAQALEFRCQDEKVASMT